MEWRDEGLVIGMRRHGESAVILEAMTRDHGRHYGLVRNGRSRALAPTLQPGNTVSLAWRARLDEHLGAYQVEPIRSRAAQVLADARALDGLNWLCALMRLIAEREPHEDFCEAATVIADCLSAPLVARAPMVRFEMALLGALGFGLDLSRCAMTGASAGLAWVSPRTGRAVTREAGAPWADRLLPLPAFLVDAGAPVAEADVAAGFRLTGHFLERDVLQPRGLSLLDARARFALG